MSNLDRYIRRATAGLPSRTRVDTAAELRVHLNERVEQCVHLRAGVIGHSLFDDRLQA